MNDADRKRDRLDQLVGVSGGGPADLPRDEQITPRLERLLELRSAWTVLASPDVIEDAAEIEATGQALTDHLVGILRSRSDVSGAALVGIDNLIGEFETSIRHVATHAPVSALRTSLPRFRNENRRGLCDLLDLLLGAGPRGESGIDQRIGAIDYLITLLCTHGAEPSAVRFDPVNLTARLASICAEQDDPTDPRLSEISGEFFSAANLDAEQLRSELRQHNLRKRKRELGSSYFAPGILRAIVTYNAALLARVEDELLDSMVWNAELDVPLSDAAPPTASVFDAKSLRPLANALQRRLHDSEKTPTQLDRIAWGLDIDDLLESERRAIENEAIGTPEDPLGTAVLVGLLCRSAAVFWVDLEELGIDPEHLTGPWVDELNALFEEEIDRHLVAGEDDLASALFDLRMKFLEEPLGDHGRTSRFSAWKTSPTPSPVGTTQTEQGAEAEHPVTRGFGDEHRSEEAEASPRESARDLMREALREGGPGSHSVRADRRPLPWSKIARITALLLAVGIGAGLALRGDPDLERLDTRELAILSPYLESGKRDGRGAGPAFRGRLSDAWLSLSRPEQERNARDLVDRLNGRGVQQIMIYDGDGRVRIQALGTQPIRVP